MSLFNRTPAHAPMRFTPALPELLELTETPSTTPMWRGGVFRRRKVESKPLTEEQRLLRAARRGDRNAFAKIIELHQRAIFGYLRSRLPDSTDAEDLCQEVFLRCYLGRAKFTNEIMLRPWLIGIARNLLREHVRRLRRRREVAWTELCLEMEEMVATNEQSYDDVMSHLPRCIDSLGQSAQQALDLHYKSRMKLAEIAGRFKRSEGAVKLLLYRARQALKRCLDARMFGLNHEEE